MAKSINIILFVLCPTFLFTKVKRISHKNSNKLKTFHSELLLKYCIVYMSTCLCQWYITSSVRLLTGFEYPKRGNRFLKLKQVQWKPKLIQENRKEDETLVKFVSELITPKFFFPYNFSPKTIFFKSNGPCHPLGSAKLLHVPLR